MSKQVGITSLLDYNENSANNLAQQVHRDGLSAVPPTVWAMAAIGSVTGGITRGPRLRSPARGPDVERVNGRWPINSQYAGQVYPVERLPADLQKKYPNSVRFTAQGYLDFETYTKVTIRLTNLTGNYEKEEALALKKLDWK